MVFFALHLPPLGLQAACCVRFFLYEYLFIMISVMMVELSLQPSAKQIKEKTKKLKMCLMVFYLMKKVFLRLWSKTIFGQNSIKPKLFQYFCRERTEYSFLSEAIKLQWQKSYCITHITLTFPSKLNSVISLFYGENKCTNMSKWLHWRHQIKTYKHPFYCCGSIIVLFQDIFWIKVLQKNHLQFIILTSYNHQSRDLKLLQQIYWNKESFKSSFISILKRHSMQSPGYKPFSDLPPSEQFGDNCSSNQLRMNFKLWFIIIPWSKHSSREQLYHFTNGHQRMFNVSVKIIISYIV